MRWVLRMLAVLALCVMPATAQQAPRKVALVIGNAAYANANVLTNPVSDSALVADSLRRAGFQTVDAKTNLGIAAFQKALRDFQSKADGAEAAVVYYAGHGIEGGGKNWLIPTDATLNSERDLDYEAISLDLVLNAVQGASLRVVILDACRNNPFGRSWRRGVRALSRGLGGVDADDVLVIYAAAPGETASDGDGANSPFARALANRLPQPGLAVQLLGGYVRDDVLKATGGAQRPFISASITGTEYYFVPRASAGTAPGSPPPADAATIELAVWNGALSASSAAAFEDYLRQYPNGRFKVQAQQNIARLRPPMTAPAVAVPSPQATRPAPALSTLAAGQSFRDCADVCPEMVSVPAGTLNTYEMDKSYVWSSKTVSVPEFAAGRYEVTLKEWKAFVAETSRADPPHDCLVKQGRYYPPIGSWKNPHFPQDDRHPVVCVSWNDAQDYVAWLSGKTGRPYRLLSETEWEYVAEIHFDASRAPSIPNMRDFIQRTGRGSGTERVGSHPSNSFGLFDLVGNVWEWTDGCPLAKTELDNQTYQATAHAECHYRGIYGGGWDTDFANEGGAALFDGSPDSHRFSDRGFRVARAL